jgi:hypothetical protein
MNNSMNITLCGSTRFGEAFRTVNAGLTLAGHLVYSVGFLGRQPGDTGKDGGMELNTQEKAILDVVHLRKIDESDAIAVLNVGGYIGESTMREVAYAVTARKKVFVLESLIKDNELIVEDLFGVLFLPNMTPLAVGERAMAIALSYRDTQPVSS